uniref:Uncharacterized protein n=1 Tax=Chrysotila carterae TaxID=13221 RepID=A0A7S4BJJ7_CHRCT
MTALLLAVLSDRVFQLDWAGHEVALRLPNIDGTALLHTLPRMRTRRLRWINRPRLELQSLMTSAPLDAILPEDAVVIASNRGFTQVAPRWGARKRERCVTKHWRALACGA